MFNSPEERKENYRLAAKFATGLFAATVFFFAMIKLKREEKITDEQFSFYCIHPQAFWVDVKAGKFSKEVEDEFVEYEEVKTEQLQLPNN